MKTKPMLDKYPANWQKDYKLEYCKYGSGAYTLRKKIGWQKT